MDPISHFYKTGDAKKKKKYGKKRFASTLQLSGIFIEIFLLRFFSPLSAVFLHIHIVCADASMPYYGDPFIYPFGDAKRISLYHKQKSHTLKIGANVECWMRPALTIYLSLFSLFFFCCETRLCIITRQFLCFNSSIISVFPIIIIESNGKAHELWIDHRWYYKNGKFTWNCMGTDAKLLQRLWKSTS